MQRKLIFHYRIFGEIVIQYVCIARNRMLFCAIHCDFEHNLNSRSTDFWLQEIMVKLTILLLVKMTKAKVLILSITPKSLNDHHFTRFPG